MSTSGMVDARSACVPGLSSIGSTWKRSFGAGAAGFSGTWPPDLCRSRVCEPPDNAEVEPRRGNQNTALPANNAQNDTGGIVESTAPGEFERQLVCLLPTMRA